jgi:phosphoglycolate phosphatase
MSYQTVFFDLDGTLTDPALGITNAVIYALGKFGIEETDRKKLCAFIGAPLREMFTESYGLSDDDAETAVAFYREYYAPRGIFECDVFVGIGDLLRELRSDGRTLVVATLKPTVFAVMVLEHFGLARYIDFVSGSELDGSRGSKSDVIEYGFLCCPSADRRSAVMVGDRAHDILGAKKAGIDAIGVLYGYGSRAELARAGAVRIAETVGELADILLEAVNKPALFDTRGLIMLIRELTQEELPAAQRLVWKTFQTFEAPDYAPEGVDTFKKCLYDPAFLSALTFYGAWRDGALAGVLAVRGGNHISMFFVREDCQRQGIGGRLFRFMLERHTAATVTVNSSPFAVGIYEKLGFRSLDGEQTCDGIRYTPMAFSADDRIWRRLPIPPRGLRRLNS